ncbi:hypothetical protein [Nocardioides sp.]|uniref:hypothetical protein n=1 Tax=Nocardioides sp. TaxID=35761 RepID=UPI002D141DC4|nr:hypothetical protein [Nocardioides sp.]HXH79943.1 hypothetical protein [Nocardioides sp.]
MSTWTIARESVELVGPLTITDNGVAITTYEVAVVAAGSRPTVWGPPNVVGVNRFVLVGPGTARPLTPGVYRIWVRHTASPETPVMDDVGTIVVT